MICPNVDGDKGLIELKSSLERISERKLRINQHIKRNDKLLEELESYENGNNNFIKFIEKFIEFMNDEKQLVEEINDFREELKNFGMTVPPKLVL